VVKELEITDFDSSNLNHETQYGMCQRPFGALRTRVVEFLA